MYITNGRVFLPEGRFEKADILCGDRITAITGGDTHVTVQELTDGEMIDATGKYIIPGLVDIHTHGAVNAEPVMEMQMVCAGCHDIMHREV